MVSHTWFFFFFFFNDTATTEIYTLSLHDALPISLPPRDLLRPPLDRDHGAHLRPLRAAQGVLADRRGVHRDRRRDRRALPLLLPDPRRHRARAEPDPGRGAPDRRLPDAADRAGRRPDGREPVAAGGHPGARARDRAAPR